MLKVIEGPVENGTLCPIGKSGIEENIMGQIPVRWTINTRRTAIIVVDMQAVFCNPDGAVYIPDAIKVVDPILRILDAGRKASIPVIYLRHVVRGDGSDTGRMRDLYPGVDAILDRNLPSVEIIEPLKPLPGDIVVDKLFFSGFHNTDLDTILRARDVDTIVICGTVTNVCCESTVRDAVHREYKVIVVSDACAAQPYPDMGWGALTSEEVQRVTLTVMAHEFGEVTHTQDLIERLAS
jgi:nicotinamidase-related amidase